MQVIRSSKPLELQAALALARLWSGHGKHSETSGLLAPVYN